MVLLTVYAFAFQGSRGISDRDEGRYTAVAQEMLQLRSPTTLQISHEWPHYTKPPLTYGIIAASMAAFGRSEWAVRAPYAIVFILTVWLIYRMGRMRSRALAWAGALVYATSLLPYVAANGVTTDTLLAFWECLACYAFLRSLDGTRIVRRRYVVLMWAAFGLAFLTKGPCGLLPLLAILVFVGWTGGRELRSVFPLAGVVVFLFVGLSWYVLLSTRNPELFRYWVDEELLGRVAGGSQVRNSRWYFALLIYGPTLLLGCLPWTWTLARAIGRARWLLSGATWKRLRASDPLSLFLLLWFLIPLGVFAVVPSRLPLYVLPLFAPLALLLGLMIDLGKLRQHLVRVGLVAWVFILVGMRWAASRYDFDHLDARRMASAVRALDAGVVQEIVFVGVEPRFGLRFYLDAEIEKVHLDLPARTSGHAWVSPETISDEIADAEPDALYVVRSDLVPVVLERLRRITCAAECLGTYYGMTFMRFRQGPPAVCGE